MSAPAGPEPITGRADPRVAVVIVNYRTGALVARCLASLVEEVRGRPLTRVVVVDNASGDDSCDTIQAAIERLDAGHWARLVRSSSNAGFGAGNNIALRDLLGEPEPPEVFWLLNPDTEVQPGALQALVEHLQRDPACGIVGSLLLEADGSPWPFAFRFPTLASEFESRARLKLVTRWLHGSAVARRMDTREDAPPATVDWVSGASFMVRRRVIQDIGLMDEGFFLYYEETEFSRRAADAGWTSVFVPQSRVMHISGQSTGVTERLDRPRRLPDYWFDSRRRYFRKVHGRLYAVLADVACLAGTLLWHAGRLVRGRPDTDPPRYLYDLIRHSALIRR